MREQIQMRSRRKGRSEREADRRNRHRAVFAVVALGALASAHYLADTVSRQEQSTLAYKGGAFAAPPSVPGELALSARTAMAGLGGPHAMDPDLRRKAAELHARYLARLSGMSDADRMRLTNKSSTLLAAGGR